MAFTTTPTVFAAATRTKMLKLSSISVSASLVKPSKRRNYLRIKIFEAPMKPYPSTTTTATPVEPLSDPQLEAPSFNSEEAEELGGVGLISSWSAINFGLCLIAAFVMHVFYAVWFLGKTTVSDGEQKDGNLDKLEMEVPETYASFGGNQGGSDMSNSVSLEESKLKEKIDEIRRMAREVRRRRSSSSGSEEEEKEIGKEWSEIEKEIGWGLSRGQRKMGYVPMKPQGSSVVRKHVKVEHAKISSAPHLKELSTKMIFKKKGFEGLENDETSEENSDSQILDTSAGTVVNDGMGILDGEKQVNLQNHDLLPSVNEGKNLNNSRTNSITGKCWTSKHRDGCRKNTVAVEAKDKQSYTKTDLWWLSLPYVLTISMRRGPDGGGPDGFFSLKVASEMQKHNFTSYTVAFENHGDANNFCHLLESFSEDLGDFSAGIVPMPTKELHEAVKSNDLKIVVVRKGELKLYAGQPLTDVEKSLHSLVERNRNANAPN